MTSECLSERGLRRRSLASLLAALRRRGPKVAAGVSDQALASGANAAINFVLARWLSVGEYGIFSLGFTIFLIASGLHNSLILEPVSVLGASRFAGNTRVYLRTVFLGQLLLSLLVAVLLAAASILIPMGAGPKKALLGAAILSPSTLTIWYFRRTQYLLGTPHKAAGASALYAVALTALAGVTRQEHWSAVTGFTLVAAAAAIACGPALCLAVGGGFGPSFASVAGAHWGFGKWFVAASFLSVGINHIQLLAVAGCMGMAGIGALRAMMNFALPLSQLMVALSSLALPPLARLYSEREGLFERAAKKLVLGYGASGLAYMIVLSLFARRLEMLVYGGRFSANAGAIPILGLWIFAVCVSSATGVVLRARQTPKAYFLALAIASAFGFLTARPLSRAYGVSGAACSMAGTYVVSAIVQLIACYRRTESSSAPVLQGAGA
jgi:O-antigen/teichoic acid export membrane protein